MDARGSSVYNVYTHLKGVRLDGVIIGCYSNKVPPILLVAGEGTDALRRDCEITNVVIVIPANILMSQSWPQVTRPLKRWNVHRVHG